MRLRADIWVSALLRRAATEGAFATILRKGEGGAGAIFVAVRGREGSNDLYGPAPQASLEDEERMFECLLSGVEDAVIAARLESEARFDPDFWLVEVEDHERRAFFPVTQA